MTTPHLFSVTWDYRCPFARNAHEHVLDALEADSPWDVTFVPFSLDQMHVDEGESPVWDRPEEFPGLLANLAGVWVRDNQPDLFPAIHRAMFAARHDDALDLRDPEVVEGVLEQHGADAAGVMAAVEGGKALARMRAEHEQAEAEHHVWGVPTFIVANQAVFVRLMHRPEGDAELAQRTVERILDLAGGWPDLNELKHTRIPR
jgi:protein-disulfide isomerase-like protein with CxxC motif